MRERGEREQTRGDGVREMVRENTEGERDRARE